MKKKLKRKQAHCPERLYIININQKIKMELIKTNCNLNNKLCVRFICVLLYYYIIFIGNCLQGKRFE